ncbi:predicted protein [Arabidopsis lyrata subsp. lyrata]|uniref:Predicted protein n=1 Tax=Arabidopsis lyrata subsp. lyrata TaxID=81972 RepID=D7L2N3_ARALL|nr:predicted protein [Arabidopsis lyrata subsp. lyrata]
MEDNPAVRSRTHATIATSKPQPETEIRSCTRTDLKPFSPEENPRTGAVLERRIPEHTRRARQSVLIRAWTLAASPPTRDEEQTSDWPPQELQRQDGGRDK